MSFIKLQADAIFDGALFIKDKVLVLKKDGTIEGLMPAIECGSDIRVIEGLISPGFINCHCHLELSHLKNKITEKTGLPGFVNQVVSKRNMPKEIIQQAIMDAEMEMLKNGIVAVGDICNTTDTIFQKKHSHLKYHNFIEVLGFDPSMADIFFEKFEKIYQSYRMLFDVNSISLSPHAPYSISQPLWKKTIHYPHNKLISIHNQESAAENEWFKYKKGAFKDLYEQLCLNTSSFHPSGKSSLQTYLQQFLAKQQLLLIHNIYTNEADIAFSKQCPNKIYWCLCPNANQYISDQLPNVALFLKNNCNLVLGTDSLASNAQLSIWEEIRTLRKTYPTIPLEKILQWATSSGAKALQISENFGDFEKGKKPGITVIKDDDAKKLDLSLF